MITRSDFSDMVPIAAAQTAVAALTAAGYAAADAANIASGSLVGLYIAPETGDEVELVFRGTPSGQTRTILLGGDTILGTPGPTPVATLPGTRTAFLLVR